MGIQGCDSIAGTYRDHKSAIYESMYTYTKKRGKTHEKDMEKAARHTSGSRPGSSEPHLHRKRD